LNIHSLRRGTEAISVAVGDGVMVLFGEDVGEGVGDEVTVLFGNAVAVAVADEMGLAVADGLTLIALQSSQSTSGR
jgi:class 3 adenylate cyclase